MGIRNNRKFFIEYVIRLYRNKMAEEEEKEGFDAYNDKDENKDEDYNDDIKDEEDYDKEEDEDNEEEGDEE